MARAHVRLQFGMWRKDDHGDTSGDARWLYTTVLQDETLNQAGVVRRALEMWASDAAMPLERAEAAFAELIERRFLVVDGHEVLVRTFIRNDNVAEQPNVLRNALTVASQVRSPILRHEIAVELRRLPPAPPPKQTKRGLFVHPDPHAVADELDPPDPPDRTPEPVDNPAPEPSRNRSANRSGTVPSEGFGNGSRTTCGGGGGGGSGSSPVGGCSGEERASAPTTDNAPQAPPPTRQRRTPQRDRGQVDASPIPGMLVSVPAGVPDLPPRCGRHARLPADVDPGPCPGCGAARQRWERDRARQRAEHAAARAAAQQACQLCDEGWIDMPPLTPTGQAASRRCPCSGGKPLPAPEPSGPDEILTPTGTT
jgi:hypothetical protein